MLLYCLKCKKHKCYKNKKRKNRAFTKLPIVKNQDLSKNKKQVDY